MAKAPAKKKLAGKTDTARRPAGGARQAASRAPAARSRPAQSAQAAAQRPDAAAPERETAAAAPATPSSTAGAERSGPRPGRNEPCYCGSGRKYKHCHLAEDDAREAAARAEAAASAAAEAAEAPVTAAPPVRGPKHQTHQPWKGSTSRGFVPRARLPRKVGGS